MAQSVERRIGNAEVGGSIPLGSFSESADEGLKQGSQIIKYRGVAQFG